MEFRFTAMATAVAVIATLAGGAPAVGAPAAAAQAGPPPSLGEIAIVPLDDRPFTAHTPSEMAQAGGFTPRMPEEALLGALLQAGDADAVGAWWAEAADGAAASVVALPMLAYGGLVAERTCATDLETALERLQVVEEVAAAHPEQPIYAFDVIQRLTIVPTNGYPGSYAGAVREWAVLMDKVENLGMEELRAEYEAVAASIPPEIRDDYTCARDRNHAVNRRMIELADEGVIDFLILGQDDASEFGPHRAEKIALQQLVAELGVEDRVEIYPGADVLGAMLVAKHVLNTLDVSPTVAVEWSRTHGDDWTAPYQDVPYGTLVREYIETLGATAVTDADTADVLLMANTAGAGSLLPFADRIHEEVARGRNVAIGDDAYAGVVDRELRDLLATRIRYGELGGWSGWNVGLSLTQAVVRSALLAATERGPVGFGQSLAAPVLQARQTMLQHAAAAHQRLLFLELVHTDLYCNIVRKSVQAYAVASGDDPQNLTFAFEEANRLATEGTEPLARTLFDEEFRGTPLLLGSDGRRAHTATIGALELLHVGLGWPRYQEVDVLSEIAIEQGDPSPAVTAAVVPGAIEIAPERATTVELTAIVRNVTAATHEAVVSARVPTGWEQPAPLSVTLAPFAVAEVPLAVAVPALAVGVPATVVVEAAAGGVEVTAETVLTPVWTNHALASEGSSATASGWSGVYAPDRAIDGNTASAASRWLTDAAAAHHLEVRFAEPATVDTVTLHQYAGFLLRDYTVSVLVDGSWQQVQAVTGNTETVPDIAFDGVLAEGVRLDITSTSDGRVRLYELEATCRVWEGCTQ